MSRPTRTQLLTAIRKDHIIELLIAIVTDTNPVDGSSLGGLAVSTADVGAISQIEPVILVVAVDGIVAAGKRYVEFIFSADFAGSILGVAFAGPRDLSYSFPVLPPDVAYGTIAYTITAGSARIVSF